MEAKADNPVKLIEDSNLHPILFSYFELCQLKQLYRQGWLKHGIPKEHCESVADHSFCTAVLCMWISNSYFPHLDSAKIVRMALVHDFGEIYAGDIIPSDEVSEADKSKLEAHALSRICLKLPGGKEYINLWEEFEAGESQEALFVRQVDRLEMGLQAGIYQRQGYEGMLEFLESARIALLDAHFSEIFDELGREK